MLYEVITNEIELGDNGENAFEYYFNHCILQVPDTLNTSNKNHYNAVMKGREYDPLFVDPYDDYNYQLDTLSAAIDAGT